MLGIMKTKPLSALAAALIAVALGLTLPERSSGQAGTDEAALAALLAEVAAQQALLAENQTKIDEKIAVIAEDVRIARIFVARGGGKAK
jgi:hypothetical protein